MYEAFDLSQAECEEMLRAGLVGRVAACTPDGPHIVPVNYSVVDDAIVIRTTPYSLLGGHAKGSVLAVEVDQFDYEYQRGWSVVARGRCESVVDGEQLDHIRRSWQPTTWAGGQRSLFLRIAWTEITGRRLGRGWDLMGSLPVRRAL
ncbi:MAG: pyridoxamine 5'-phosphate oxidase family protein [Nocardioides sp.]|nr:pyridoxamine 5'-phosphate oxidase family protein [Nocardioides sp.]